MSAGAKPIYPAHRPSFLHSDNNANAAISAASSFNYLSNAAKFFFSNSNGSVSSVTVNSSAAKGSNSNPHVIHSSNQWIYFANLINANNASFNSNSVYFLIDADLDFAGNSLNPVGTSAEGFKANLFASKHSFKNAKISGIANTADSSIYIGGLFYYLNSAKVYDLAIDSSCTFNFAANKSTIAGTLTAYATNAVLTNCSSSANITVNNGGATVNNLYIQVGGLIGQAQGSSISFYLCSYKGTITETAFDSSQTSAADNCIRMGGFIGALASSITSTILDGCYINAKLVGHRGGINYAAVGGSAPIGNVLKVSNTIIYLDQTYDGVTNSVDIRLLTYGSTYTTAPTLTNVYIYSVQGKGSLHQGTPVANCTNFVTNSTMTGVSSYTKASNLTDLYNKAKANSNITSKFDFLPDGTPTPKFAPFFLFLFLGRFTSRDCVPVS